METDDRERIEQTALRLLASREHSVHQLHRKLASRGFDEELIGRVLDDLIQRNLLSDARFSQLYAEQRIGKGYGPLKLRSELREKGLASSLVDACLDLDDDVWMGILTEVHNKKYGPDMPCSRAELVRRARFLEYRGFTAAQVARLLNIDD